MMSPYPEFLAQQGPSSTRDVGVECTLVTGTVPGTQAKDKEDKLSQKQRCRGQCQITSSFHPEGTRESLNPARPWEWLLILGPALSYDYNMGAGTGGTPPRHSHQVRPTLSSLSPKGFWDGDHNQLELP